MLDVLCIGFGPAALSVGIAIAEYNASTTNPDGSRSLAGKTFSSLGGLQQALGTRSREANNSSSSSSTRHDSNPTQQQQQRKLKVGFIESHSEFKWHPGMMLEGSRMQISYVLFFFSQDQLQRSVECFLKDLVTLRNPQSPYTFLSYLHSLTPSRLVTFVSLGTSTPTRREYADYMSWAAAKLEEELTADGGQFAFGEEVIAIKAVIVNAAVAKKTPSSSSPSESDSDSSPSPPPSSSPTNDESLEVQGLRVSSRDLKTGQIRVRFARNVVLSTGGTAKFPPVFTTPEMQSSLGVLHSSEYLEKVNPLLDSILSHHTLTSGSPSRPIRIAVIGAGQSASEIFLSIRNFLSKRLEKEGSLSLSQRPQIDLLIRKGALRPADDSAFSNEVFDPGMSQAVFGLDDEDRARVMKESRATNYSVVNPITLEAVFETMYAQKVNEDILERTKGKDGTSTHLDPKLTILPYTELSYASASPSSSNLSLTLTNTITHESHTQVYDGVICATGYDRQSWRKILFGSSQRSESFSSLSCSSPMEVATQGSSHSVPPHEVSLAELFESPPPVPHQQEEVAARDVASSLEKATGIHRSRGRPSPTASETGEESMNGNLSLALSRLHFTKPSGDRRRGSNTSDDEGGSVLTGSSSLSSEVEGEDEDAREASALTTPPSTMPPSRGSSKRRPAAAFSPSSEDVGGHHHHHQPYEVQENYRLRLPHSFTLVSSPPCPSPSAPESNMSHPAITDSIHTQKVTSASSSIGSENVDSVCFSRIGKFRPTVWLQGSNEQTHGISDSLLSVLSIRSGEVVNGILSEGWFGEDDDEVVI